VSREDEKNEYRICFGMTAEDLDPDLVTSLLGLAPSLTFRRGDVTRGGRVLGFGKWEHQFPNPEGDRGEEYLGRYAEQICALIPSLAETGAKKYYFHVWMTTYCGQINFDFRPDILGRLAKIPSSLFISVFDESDTDGP
jgi:hypothetical protein